ncbi:DNA polymerase III subunit beta [Solibacillus sp. FSL H8-0523]|uniref:DNA polymerase III subunit beta n=1 Tax=Solibacillus sp. FSL H8-0523 TaxID=2954511 RepID=UPI003100CD0F
MVNGSLKKTSNVTVITRKSLVEALKKLSLAIDGKIQVPIYQTVKFDVTESQTTITATNGDTIAVTSFQNSYFTDKASFIFSYKYLNDFLKKSKADLIEFDTAQKDKISIKADTIKFEVVASDASEYPLMPNIEFDYLEMDVNDFKTVMKNTVFACATSESRPVLTGVHIDYDTQKHLRFVATDSHRLALYTLKNYKNQERDQLAYQITVPHASLIKISKMISKATKTVVIGFNHKYTLIKFDDMEYWLRNLEGNYPDISRLIPDNFKSTINLYSDELLEATSTLSIIAKHDRNNVIRFNSTENQTTLNSDSPELGKMTAELLVSSRTGEEILCSFSSNYFTDALKALDCKIVTLNFNGSKHPFTLVNPLDDKALHLILPVRTY